MRLPILIILIFFLASPYSYAQKERINLSEKHVKKVEKKKNPSKKLKKYRKLYKKDSARFVKEKKKLAAKKLDSLDKAMKKYVKTGVLDTLNFPEGYRKYLTKSITDSGAVAKEGKSLAKTEGNKWLKDNPEYKEYQKMLKENPELAKWMKTYGSDPAALNDMPDSLFKYKKTAVPDLLESKAGSLKEVKGFQEQAGAMKPITDMQKTYKEMGEGYMKKGEQYSDEDFLKEKGKEEAIAHATQMAAGFLSKNEGALGGLQKQMTKLKKKYSSLQNSEDLSSGVKRKSLKGRPVDERFILGGNFDVQVAKPIKVDVSPLIGFRVNKPFTLGVGGTYRLDIGYEDSSIKNVKFDTKVYGYNAFASYDIIKRFFLYTEYTYMAEIQTDKLTAEKKTKWEPSFVAGIGRSFKVHPKLTGTVMLLYNIVNSSVANPPGNRFQVKFGFQTNELTFKKIKKPF